MIEFTMSSILLVTQFITVSAMTQVNITKLYNNFVVDTIINNFSYQDVIDTGSFSAVLYDESIQYNTSFKCRNSSLIEDQSYINFCDIYDKNSLYNISIGTSHTSNAAISRYKYIAIQNEELHQWEYADGYIGLSYDAQQNKEQTTFQKLVKYSSPSNSSLLFGLDFRSSDSSSDVRYIDGITTSTMQIGGVKEEFHDTIDWLFIPGTSTVNNYLHSFFLEGLHFCDNSVAGNYSMTWHVVVDTGSSCLELPSEFYDTFESWFNNSNIFDDKDDLPAFSFNVTVDGSHRYYIPLGDLLVPASSIHQENGAPYVTIANIEEKMRVCVLRGSSIMSGRHEYYTTPPVITFGSLVLQSIYFSGDYASRRVGLANKLSDKFKVMLHDNNQRGGCYPPTTCVEEQIYVPSDNQCRDFTCGKYYFMESKGDSNACQYKTSTFIGGLVFVLLIAILEIVSFFALQHSGRIVVASNNYRAVGADAVTRTCEFAAASILDYLVTYVLHWVPITSRVNAIAAENGGDHQQGIAPAVVVDAANNNDGLTHV